MHTLAFANRKKPAQRITVIRETLDRHTLHALNIGIVEYYNKHHKHKLNNDQGPDIFGKTPMAWLSDKLSKTPSISKLGGSFVIDPRLRAIIERDLGENAARAVWQVLMVCEPKSNSLKPKRAEPIDLKAAPKKLRTQETRSFGTDAKRLLKGTIDGLKFGPQLSSTAVLRGPNRGKVVSYRNPYFRVRWADGEREDFRLRDLLPLCINKQVCFTADQIERERTAAAEDRLSITLDAPVLELLALRGIAVENSMCWSRDRSSAVILECEDHQMSLSWSAQSDVAQTTLNVGVAFKASVHARGMSLICDEKVLRVPLLGKNPPGLLAGSLLAQQYLVIRREDAQPQVRIQEFPFPFVIRLVCALATIHQLPHDVGMRIAAATAHHHVRPCGEATLPHQVVPASGHLFGQLNNGIIKARIALDGPSLQAVVRHLKTVNELQHRNYGISPYELNDGPRFKITSSIRWVPNKPAQQTTVLAPTHVLPPEASPTDLAKIMPKHMIHDLREVNKLVSYALYPVAQTTELSCDWCRESGLI